MPHPLAADIDRELHALLLQRVRLALAIVFGGILAFAAVDLWAGSQPLVFLYALKLCGLVLLAIGYVILERPRIASHASVVAWLLVAATCAAIASSGILSGETPGAAILCVTVALASAMLFPWGAGAQLAAATAAAAAVAANFYWVHGRGLEPANFPGAAAALGALAMSLGLTYEMQRYRVGILRENVERKRAEDQVTRLNATLERRVRERTAELGAAKLRLEEEVAERQLASEALRKTQKQLQDIVDNSTAVIYVKDINCRYLLVNTRFETLFHVTRAAVAGKTDYGLFPAETAAVFQANDHRVLEANQPLHFEELVPQDDGIHTYISVKFPLYDTAGVTYGVCGISTDITDRKQAEERARHHQAELAHVLRLGTMGEIVSGLAHEINQPLAGIANYARGCQRRIESGNINIADLGYAVDQIAREALRAGEILRRLRPLIRKESPRHEAIDVNHVVTEAVRIIRSEARLRGITVELTTVPELPQATGDSIQIEQVVMNLLLNAVEALEATSGEERVITVRTSVIDGGAIEVAVRDTGEGLAPAVTDRLFDAFFTTKPNGLGMGLAISRSIIEAHNGRVWATRNPEGGSTFHFTLPRS